MAHELLFQRLALGGDQVAREPLSLIAGLATVVSAGVGIMGTISAAGQQQQAMAMQMQAATQQLEASGQQQLAYIQSAAQQQEATYQQRNAQFQQQQAQIIQQNAQMDAIRAQQQAALLDVQMGEMQAQQQELVAQQLVEKGQEERAAGAMAAADERRKLALAQSSLLARAAASGGTDDPTIVHLGEGLTEEGEMRALLEFYKGNSAARDYETQAIGAKISGQSALLQGIGSTKGKLAASMGDMAQLAGASEMQEAQAGLANADMTRNLSQAEATRAQATVARLSGTASLYSSYADIAKSKAAITTSIGNSISTGLSSIGSLGRTAKFG